MSDDRKYDYDITTGRRTGGDRDSGRSRGSSIFGGGSRERERDNDRDERSPRGRSEWTEDRENLSWGGGKDGGDRDRSQDDDRS